MILKLLTLCFFLQSTIAFGGFFIKTDQCTTTLAQAKKFSDSMNAHFWKNGEYYTDGSTWTDANAFEDLNTLMLTLGIDNYEFVNHQSKLAKLGAQNMKNWDDFFRGSYDDAQWVLMLYYKIADYLRFHGKDNHKFMESAGAIYDYVSAQWDDTCGGGLYWSGAHDYKNAITNQLYLLSSANGYLRHGNLTYLENAKKTWDWLLNSGMRNEKGLWNDGLVLKTCKNNGQTTWTYNQAVVASGLGYLGKILNDTSLFDQAEVSLDATIQHLTVNGILKESCDNATSTTGQCDHNQQLFKGLFTKHLMYYLEAANDSNRAAKYKNFLGAQQSAVYHYGKNTEDLVGNVWYASDQGGSTFSPETTTSGIEAFMASAKYGPCEDSTSPLFGFLSK